MIPPKFLIDELDKHGINFFAGVPDSLLKSVCACIADNVDDSHNIIAANEGGAVALAAGHYLATGDIPVVYMQNSGEGNAINPLASLTDKEVYNIPILLLIGWRGRPGERDEPQHAKQGAITFPLLSAMGIRSTTMSRYTPGLSMQLDSAVEYMRKSGEAFAFVIEKDTFEPYQMRRDERPELTLGREEAIRTVAGATGENDCIVSTTGMISRELFEYRASQGQGHGRDFLTVGSMGHASQIALGIALAKKDRRVWCFDGDGALIMHAGGIAIIGSRRPQNLVHVVFNNGAHDSVGGQPTVGLDIDLPAIARAVGYENVFSVSSAESLGQTLSTMSSLRGLTLLEIKVKKGNRKDLGRPTTTPIENKEAFMAFLKG